MFNIRNVATSGFDRAIVAMRRENGGREVSDSYWTPVEDEQYCTFAIGEKDAEECERMIKCGAYNFMKFVVVWMHLEADARWWGMHCERFLVTSEIARRGDRVTQSVMTTYAELRKLAEMMYPDKDQDWKEFVELCAAFYNLPESWMIIPKVEKMEG